MLKGKGVFIVITMILVAGLLITSYTSHVINRQEKSETMAEAFIAANEETAAETTADTSMPPGASYYQRSGSTDNTEAAPGPGAAPTMQSGQNNAAETAAGSPASGKQPEREMAAAENDTEETTEGLTAVLISPLSGVPETVVQDHPSSMSLEEEKDEYIERLDELDTQIEKLWKSDTEVTTNSMKQTADYELKMWDNELNKIYQLLRNSLDEKAAEDLKQDELLWIRDRDAAALAASKQVNNSSLASLEYTKSLADITKNRTYELVDVYYGDSSAE